ncbi:hypothetical protein LIER_19606 [Lithospermum erythrorhizon]|uniref:Uncharacterized protein n=1 Tax=Lithospermum erythrorhizon TaxID=34254 RepID=A0AAV3QLC8_LITER
MISTFLDIPKDVDQEKKKSKKKKQMKGADDGGASEPKKKLRKEEHATKRDRRAERKEDITAVIIKRRKVKGKLKINENKSKVGNKRIPKNVTDVSTENVVLNSEEEEVK